MLPNTSIFIKRDYVRFMFETYKILKEYGVVSLESFTWILRKPFVWQIEFTELTKTKGNCMSKVLLVTNDSSLTKLVDLTLKYNGFIIQSATHAETARALLSEVRFDLIMLDYNLKHESGVAFYKSLRQLGTSIPVLMLGEGELDEFILKDLSTDHYDYLMKPFKFRELKIKINALMKKERDVNDFISFGEFQIDVKQQLLMVRDRILQLGKMEMRILLLLAKQTGGVVSPKKLKKLMESEGNFYNMTTFYYVSRLRNKMKQFAGEVVDIVLIKDQGYQLQFRG
jgi:DNA-binding response OmpR family regulator